MYQRNKIIFTHVRASIYILSSKSFIPSFWIKQTRFNENLNFALRRFTVKSLRRELRTFSGISHAHHSCGRKQGKLSGSRLSNHLQIRINTVFRYTCVRWIFPHFLDKIKFCASNFVVTSGLGAIPGWALVIHYLFLLLFSAL